MNKFHEENALCYKCLVDILSISVSSLCEIMMNGPHWTNVRSKEVGIMLSIYFRYVTDNLSPLATAHWS